MFSSSHLPVPSSALLPVGPCRAIDSPESGARLDVSRPRRRHQCRLVPSFPQIQMNGTTRRHSLCFRPLQLGQPGLKPSLDFDQLLAFWSRHRRRKPQYQVWSLGWHTRCCTYRPIPLASATIFSTSQTHSPALAPGVEVTPPAHQPTASGLRSCEAKTLGFTELGFPSMASYLCAATNIVGGHPVFDEYFTCLTWEPGRK